MATRAQKFFAAFRGLESAYGIYRLASTKRSRDQKQEGKAHTVQRQLTVEVIQDHLDGKQGIGIVPITEDNLCRWGAIDIDDYSLEIPLLVKRIEEHGLPVITCRTKSGGAHLYLFFTEPTRASLVRNKLQEIASILGFGSCEIFPKQTELAEGDIGNWLNMPYFNAEETMRYGYSVTGEALELDEFLDLVATRQIKVEAVHVKKKTHKKNEDFDGAPPCLEILGADKIQKGTRNKGLYNMGVYLKKRFPEDWHDRLVIFNDRYVSPPLASIEVKTIAQSLRNKNYFYTCKDSPICDHCDQPTCRTKEFGVGQTIPRLVALQKLDMPDFPLWNIDIDGYGRIRNLTSQQVLTISLFRQACMDQLNLIFPTLKRDVWDAVLQPLLDSADIVEVRDGGVAGVFAAHFDEFLETGRESNIEEVLLGTPIISKGRIYFRNVDFAKHLQSKGFKGYDQQRITTALRDMHVESKRHILNKKRMMLLSLPWTESSSVIDPPDMGEDVL